MPPIPRKRSSSIPPILGVLLYLCLHRLMQKDQIRHGNQYGEGRVLGGQPHHCVCTNASRSLSATAEFPIHAVVLMLQLSIYSFIHSVLSYVYSSTWYCRLLPLFYQSAKQVLAGVLVSHWMWLRSLTKFGHPLWPTRAVASVPVSPIRSPRA